MQQGSTLAQEVLKDLQIQQGLQDEQREQALTKLQSLLTQKLNKGSLDKLNLVLTSSRVQRYDLEGANTTELGRALNFLVTELPDHSYIANFELHSQVLPDLALRARVVKQDNDDDAVVEIYALTPLLGFIKSIKRCMPIERLADLARLPEVKALLACEIQN